MTEVDHSASNKAIAALLAAQPDMKTPPPGSLGARMIDDELFNQAAKDLSPGMINQIEANGIMYSIVHNPAYKITVAGEESRLNPEFFTVYIQNTAIADPDECLVDTDSTDTLFDAVVMIRNHIEKSIIKAFMPEVKL